MPFHYDKEGLYVDSNSPAPDSVARFYDNYLNCLHKASIPEKQRRWYVKLIEAFIKTHSGGKIKSLSDQEVSGYLEMIGRQNRLSGRQFAQCINAKYGFFIAIYSQQRPAIQRTARQTGCASIPRIGCGTR